VSAFLPIQDPDRGARAAALQTARGAYRYNYTHVSPLAMVDRVPFHDDFSADWLSQMAEHASFVLTNSKSLNLNIGFDLDKLESLESLESLETAGPELAVQGLKEFVSKALSLNVDVSSPTVHAKSLDDYARLFSTIGLPPVSKDYAKDDSFAGMRVCGPNPVMIRRLTGRDPRLPLTDAEFAGVVPGDSLDAALAEARLYLADYQILEGIECGNFPREQKYVYAPLALFVVQKATKRLVPVAIQCKQQPGPQNPVFTPHDGYNWLIAKTIVEIADGCIHETSTHLARTHILMEPFVVSTYRQLAPNHPLGVLLGPHFEGTLAINEQAWKQLIADKGGVDQLLGCSIKASRGLAGTAVMQTRIQESYLPKTLAARGVADREALPDYPYRDDAALYYDAIQTWVAAYLGLYYRTPTDLQSDLELQAWVREIASSDGGRIAGMPNDGTFRVVEELRDVVTFVLFTCSVQHAAVNFPQFDLMSYAPNMPLAGYRPAPTGKAPATEADYLAMLPPLDMAELQLDLGYLLGSLHYTQLGQYGDRFRDPQVAPLLRNFQNQLGEIDRTIAERNRTRRAYTTLAATGIPQSINV
jgi:arachidonate 15-lipoxygenase